MVFVLRMLYLLKAVFGHQGPAVGVGKNFLRVKNYSCGSIPLLWSWDSRMRCATL